MSVWAKVFLVLGGCGMLLAVMMGAFGAHALKKTLAPDLMAIYETAVNYHFYHALGLLAVGLLMPHVPPTALLRGSGILMIVGLLLFRAVYMRLPSAVSAGWRHHPAGRDELLLAWLLWVIAVVRAG